MIRFLSIVVTMTIAFSLVSVSSAYGGGRGRSREPQMMGKKMEKTERKIEKKGRAEALQTMKETCKDKTGKDKRKCLQKATKHARDERIEICHKTGTGMETIKVSPNSWRAHERHGDTKGPCAGSSSSAASSGSSESSESSSSSASSES